MSRSTTGQQSVAELAGIKHELMHIELRLRDLVAALRELAELLAERV